MTTKNDVTRRELVKLAAIGSVATASSLVVGHNAFAHDSETTNSETKYAITIEFDDETLRALMEQNLFLYGFKGVKSNAGGGKSTVWLKTQNFSRMTKVTWSNVYGGYISHQEVLQGGIVVDSSNSKKMQMGQTLKVQPSGVISVATNGPEGKIAIANQGTKPWNCGLMLEVNDVSAPFCAFPLNGNFELVMEPSESVLLAFGAGPVNTGTVIEATESKSLIVTLTGETPEATVGFNINSSWDTKGNSNAKVLPLDTDLSKTLIES